MSAGSGSLPIVQKHPYAVLALGELAGACSLFTPSWLGGWFIAHARAAASGLTLYRWTSSTNPYPLAPQKPLASCMWRRSLRSAARSAARRPRPRPRHPLCHPPRNILSRWVACTPQA